MNDNVKFAILFALESQVSSYLESLERFRPHQGDMEDLVAACDWLMSHKLPKYVNMGQFRAAVEKLREKVQSPP